MPTSAKRTGLPSLLPSPTQSWVDLSVLDEMALRLRVCGAWDNAVGDGLAQLKDRIALLERWGKFTRHAEDRVRRPLQTWADCRTVLLAITQFRSSNFADIAAPVEQCLRLAVTLDGWERECEPIPSDIRCMMHGVICVEWEKPYRSEIMS